MFVTATTVKDTLPNVQRFVRRNLNGGADHLVVFLDAKDPEVQEWLDEHPHVSCVPTHEGWWRTRPDNLNVRQRIHANIVRSLMTVLDPGGWSCHIDADEVVWLDREQLDALGPEVPVVLMKPLEAVSRLHWDGEVTEFKRLLEPEDLTLLSVLGVIDEPKNPVYFHGHTTGKSAMRPALDRWHTLHAVVDAERKELAATSPPWARVLHYESVSGDEFVRKWTTMLAAGKMANFRPGREPTAVALRALIAKGLTEEQARPYLTRIYERTTRDDVETLRELGLLEEIDPDAGERSPEPLGDERRRVLDAMLAAVRDERKRTFQLDTPVSDAVEVMGRVARAAGQEPPSAPEPDDSSAGKAVKDAVRPKLPWRR